MNTLIGDRNKYIRNRFNNAVLSYDSVAHVQRKCAEILIDFLIETNCDIYPRSILDLGTGTGYVAEILLSKFEKSYYTLNDISSKMLDFCREKFCSSKNIEYINGDFESLNFDRAELVVSNFALQWSNDFLATLNRFLKNSNFFAFTCLLDGTFEEWNELLKNNNIAQASHKYPSANELLRSIVENNDLIITSKVIHFDISCKTPKDFCLYLKKLGASYSGASTLDLARLKILLSEKKPVNTTYNVMFCIVKSK